MPPLIATREFVVLFTRLQLHEHSNSWAATQGPQPVEEGCFLWETHVNVLPRSGTQRVHKQCGEESSPNPSIRLRRTVWLKPLATAPPCPAKPGCQRGGWLGAQFRYLPSPRPDLARRRVAL